MFSGHPSKTSRGHEKKVPIIGILDLVNNLVTSQKLITSSDLTSQAGEQQDQNQIPSKISNAIATGSMTENADTGKKH